MIFVGRDRQQIIVNLTAPTASQQQDEVLVRLLLVFFFKGVRGEWTRSRVPRATTKDGTATRAIKASGGLYLAC